MFGISYMLDMSTSDKIAALGFILAAITFWYSFWRYRRDQKQQQAAQTRQELQAIIGDCNRFLRPLSASSPYPILHTAAAITKEFPSRMGKSPQKEKVLQILENEDLLHSICVEGWVSSTQILRMMNIVEEVERKAASRNLRGKLLLICDISFLLTGIVAQICSPESFFKMLWKLAPCEVFKAVSGRDNQSQDVEDILNDTTIDLQNGICKQFDEEYSEIIKENLLFIRIAANAFLKLDDSKLIKLARSKEHHGHVFPTYENNSPRKIHEMLVDSEKQDVCKQAEQIRKHLLELDKIIDQEDYKVLGKLIDQITKDLNPLEEKQNTHQEIKSALV